MILLLLFVVLLFTPSGRLAVLYVLQKILESAWLFVYVALFLFMKKK